MLFPPFSINTKRTLSNKKYYSIFETKKLPFYQIYQKNEHKRIDECSIEKKKKEILSFFLPTAKAFSILKLINFKILQLVHARSKPIQQLFAQFLV